MSSIIQKNPSLFNLITQVINIAIIVPLVLGAMQFSKMSTKIELMNDDMSSVQKDMRSISSSVQKTQQDLRDLTKDLNRANNDLLRDRIQANEKVRILSDELEEMNKRIMLITSCIKTKNLKSNFCLDVGN